MYKTLLVIMIFLGPALIVAQNSQVLWSSFNMGYASSTSSSNNMVKSIVGQPFVGTMWQGNNFIESGFFADILFSGPSAVKEEEGIPHSYSLEQNYPNPFNPSTVIRYEIPFASRVTLKVYNLLGQEVASLINEEKQPGKYDMKVEGSNLASGVYYYRLNAICSADPSKSFTQVKKSLLLK